MRWKPCATCPTSSASWKNTCAATRPVISRKLIGGLAGLGLIGRSGAGARFLGWRGFGRGADPGWLVTAVRM
jgi:hypothetical protein